MSNKIGAKITGLLTATFGITMCILSMQMDDTTINCSNTIKIYNKILLIVGSALSSFGLLFFLLSFTNLSINNISGNIYLIYFLLLGILLCVLSGNILNEDDCNSSKENSIVILIPGILTIIFSVLWLFYNYYEPVKSNQKVKKENKKDALINEILKAKPNPLKGIPKKSDPLKGIPPKSDPLKGISAAQGQDQKSPVAQDQKSPVAQDQVQGQKAPLVQDQKAPVVQDQKAPLVQDQKAPVVQGQKSPVAQGQQASASQGQKSPVKKIIQKVIGTQINPTEIAFSGRLLTPTKVRKRKSEKVSPVPLVKQESYNIIVPGTPEDTIFNKIKDIRRKSVAASAEFRAKATSPLGIITERRNSVFSPSFFTSPPFKKPLAIKP